MRAECGRCEMKVQIKTNEKYHVFNLTYTHGNEQRSGNVYMWKNHTIPELETLKSQCDAR